MSNVAYFFNYTRNGDLIDMIRHIPVSGKPNKITHVEFPSNTNPPRVSKYRIRIGHAGNVKVSTTLEVKHPNSEYPKEYTVHVEVDALPSVPYNHIEEVINSQKDKILNVIRGEDTVNITSPEMTLMVGDILVCDTGVCYIIDPLACGLQVEGLRRHQFELPRVSAVLMQPLIM